MGARAFYDDLFANANRAALFPDKALAELAEWSLLEREHGILRGEIVFRAGWLYRNGTCPDVLWEAFAGILSGLGDPLAGSLRSLGKSDAPPVQEDFPEFTQLAEGRWFFSRMRDFASADGIIPVVRSGEAFPLFFRILREADSPCGCFTNQDGDVLSEWDQHAEGLWEALGNRYFKVRVQLPEGVNVAGASFALPVFFHHSTRGKWPREILATGAIRGGSVERVDHCDTKADLARRLGVDFWISPVPAHPPLTGSKPRQIWVEPGTAVAAALQTVRSAVELESPPLDVFSASKILEELKRLGAEGAISMEELRIRVGQSIQILEAAGKQHLKNKIRDARLFLASMENHAGNAEGAWALLQKVFDEGKDHLAVVGQAMARQVVSLVDMGRLSEGEQMGRSLLRLLEERGESLDPEMYLSMKMEATGALGGEALLHKALRTGDISLAEESRRLLDECLRHARELRDLGKEEHLKSEARLILWDAFMNPAFALLPRLPQLEELLHQTGARARDTAQYIRRALLLALYRFFLKQSSDAPGRSGAWILDVLKKYPLAILEGFQDPLLSFRKRVEKYTLPEVTSEFLKWVRASALKYRGALYAGVGWNVEAERDFCEALALLRPVTAPVLVVLRWSIAAQAVWSLPETQNAEIRGVFERDRVYAVDYLRADPSGAEYARRLETGDELPATLRWFCLQYPY